MEYLVRFIVVLLAVAAGSAGTATFLHLRHVHDSEPHEKPTHRLIIHLPSFDFIPKPVDEVIVDEDGSDDGERERRLIPAR